MRSVDVVVPCYQYGHFLRQCVQSVLCQPGVDVRVLIIDDASPDNTEEIGRELATQDPRVTFVRHPANVGHIRTYNEGIDWASSDYMLLLSADDYLLAGALERGARVLNSHPSVGLVFGRGADPRKGDPLPALVADGLQKLQYRVLRGRDFIRMTRARNIVSTPTAIVRTALQKQIGGYLADLPHAGDMEMWLRFAAHADVAQLSCYQAVYRLHSSNMSRTYMTAGWLPDLEQRKEALNRFFDRFGCLLVDGESVREELAYALSLCAIGLASAAFNTGDLDACRSIRDFAVATDVRCRGTIPWVKLRCKQAVGFKVWSALRPVFGRATTGS